MKNEIKPVLHKEDMVRIFRVSDQTLDRWTEGALQGLSNFVLPLDIPGRRRAWSSEAVEAYLSQNPQPVSSPKMESPSKLKKRHLAAMQKLSKDHGITVQPQPRNQ